MSRYARRTDANHGAIVEALRGVGAFVFSLAALGKGAPDLLVGFRRQWVVLEVKDGAKSASRRRLTEAEAEWIGAARAMYLPVAVVKSTDEALRAIGVVEAISEVP